MKKLISFSLALILILGLIGCAAETPETSAPDATASQAASNAETPASEEGAEEAIDYPDGDLRILVPFKTGGALDVQVRTTAQFLEEELGTTVIVENVEGAGGQLGTAQYLEEEANTTTILLTDAWLLAVTPELMDVPYTMEDYMPIIDHNTTNFCLYAAPGQSGIESYEDLEAYAADNKVIFGSGAVGTSLYIVQKTMFDLMGAESETVTQNNTAEGIANLIAGTVDVSMSSFKDAADYVENGDIVPLVWFGDEAYSDDFYESVPALTEVGSEMIYKGFYYYSIRKGTDQAIIDHLYNAFNNVYNNPDFQAERDTLGYAPSGIDAEEINTFVTAFGEQAKTTFSLD